MSAETIERRTDVTAEDVMTPTHPRWVEFIGRLCGPDGCNFSRQPHGELTWKCAGGGMRTAERILGQMGGIDVAGSIAYFRSRSARCDCDIPFDVCRGYGRLHRRWRNERRGCPEGYEPHFRALDLPKAPVDAAPVIAAFRLLQAYGLFIGTCADQTGEISDEGDMLEYAYDPAGVLQCETCCQNGAFNCWRGW